MERLPFDPRSWSLRRLELGVEAMFHPVCINKDIFKTCKVVREPGQIGEAEHCNQAVGVRVIACVGVVGFVALSC